MHFRPGQIFFGQKAQTPQETLFKQMRNAEKACCCILVLVSFVKNAYIAPFHWLKQSSLCMMREQNGLNQQCYSSIGWQRQRNGFNLYDGSICASNIEQTFPPPSNLIYQNKQFVFSAIWLNLSPLCCYKWSLDSYACPDKSRSNRINQDKNYV